MNVKEKYSSDAQLNMPSGDLPVNGLTLDELAFLSGTTAEVVKQLVDMDLINPRELSATCLFSIETVQTVRKILRLRRHLQISFDSMALIFDLLDRIDALEKRIGDLEKE